MIFVRKDCANRLVFNDLNNIELNVIEVQEILWRESEILDCLKINRKIENY